jgi:NADH dehydrogenase (ubiquinone) 1 alpha subcomplex subunit 5
MHPTARLLAARLPPFAPTGITGVLTHPHPRPTLIALYNHTLSLLQQLPEHSVYRQSTENLTKARLDIVSSVKPASYETYASARTQSGLPEQPALRDVGRFMRRILTHLEKSTDHQGNKYYVQSEMKRWGPILAEAASGSGSVLPDQTIDQASSTASQANFNAATPQKGQTLNASQIAAEDQEAPLLEPQLTAEQVEQIEEKIGEGLIEEIIEEGWAELECAKVMLEDKVWEPLAEVPEEGQWVGFERTPKTSEGA